MVIAIGFWWVQWINLKYIEKIKYECICSPQNKILIFGVHTKESMNSKDLSQVC